MSELGIATHVCHTSTLVVKIEAPCASLASQPAESSSPRLTKRQRKTSKPSSGLMYIQCAQSHKYMHAPHTLRDKENNSNDHTYFIASGVSLEKTQAKQLVQGSEL